MKKLLFISLGIMLAFSLILSGCNAGSGKDETPNKEVAPSAEKSAPAEILVGAIVSMTGMNAMTGADQKWAYEQAMADINAAGGVKVGESKLPIKLVFADDKSTTADTAAAMEKLVKVQGIKLVLGTNITPQNIAAATIAEKYKVYYSANVSWLDQFGDQKFQWASDLFFTAGSAAEVPFKIWDAQPEAERPQRIALMMEDNPDGQGFGGLFSENAKKYKYNIVVNEAYTPGAKDFSSSILKMKGSNVDALLWLGSPTDSIVMIRQMKEQKFKPKYVHGWKGFWPNEFETALGADADYTIHDGFWSETLPYPGAAELGKKYKDAHKGQDSVSVGIPYADVQVLAQAIEKAGSLDPAKVRDEVFGGNFPGTVMGDIKFDEKGLGFVSSLALQWYQGERKPVYPDVGSWKLKWIP